jgi:hypothetical protein
MSSNPGPMKKAPNSMSPLNVSYDKAYDDQSDEKKATQSREEFKKAAKAYNKKEYGTTEPTKAAEDGKLSDAQTKKLIVSKLKRDKTAKDTNKARADKGGDSKKSETKSDKPKTKTRKQMRAEKRVGRLKKKQEKKGSLTPGQQKRLDRNKSKAKGEEVKEKDRTNVGKAIKKGVDKVKDVVSKDSPAEKMDEVSTGKKTRKEFNKM